MEIRQYLAVMVEKATSDVYLTVGLPPMYRIEGTISPHGNEELTREGLARCSASPSWMRGRKRCLPIPER